MSLNEYELRELYRRTRIVRRPRHGIVKGYHELPYICLGDSFESGFATTRVKGRIHVSPRFIVRPAAYFPSYEDIFGEDNVDLELSGRFFGYLGFPNRPVECSSERLEVQHFEGDMDRVLAENLDELDRYEDITTGVFLTPDSRYYPVSVERFIASIVDDEFAV
ncbi:MAG: hypothetical protein ACLFTT_02930 [Candidatus Hydrogenedentota bacterium]